MGMKELEKEVAQTGNFKGMPGADLGEDVTSEDEEFDAHAAAIARGDIIEDESALEADDDEEEVLDTGAEEGSQEDTEQSEESDEEESGEESDEESDEESGEESDEESSEESSEESNEESGEESGEESDGKGPAKKKTIMVPKQAMDAKIRKYKIAEAARIKAEAEAARLREQYEGAGTKPTKEEADAAEAEFEQEIAELSERHAELTLQGNVEEAAKLNVEILRKMQSHQSTAISSKVHEESKREIAQRELNQVADRIADTFPVLNPASDAFDEALGRRVVRLRDLYAQEGLSLATALSQAVDDLLPVTHPEYFAESQDEDTESDPEKAADQRREERKKKAVAKKVKATRQPEKLGGSSKRSEADRTLTLDDLTEAQFEALSEKELAKLRGDII